MICGLVLAAGRSRRMGRQKLLLPVDGQPMIGRIVDAALCSPLDRVYVVVGQDGSAIAEVLAGREVTFVANPDAEGDMLSSLRCGLRALPEACRAFLVILGDQPTLSPTVIQEILRTFATAGKGIVAPTCDGRRGHPILIGMQYRDEILTSYEQIGLRGLLMAHGGDIAEAEVAMPGILEDVDTPEDYQQLNGHPSASA